MTKLTRIIPALLLLNASWGFAQEIVQQWTFTGQPDGATMATVPNTGTGAATRFATPLKDIAVVGNALLIQSSAETQSYSTPVNYTSGRYQLDIEIASCKTAGEAKSTFHFGFMANASSAVTADISLEATTAGLKVAGRALGKGSMATDYYDFGPDVQNVSLRLIVDLDRKTMQMLRKDSSSAGQFVPVGEGKLAADRTGSLLRLRATGAWKDPGESLRLGAISVTKLP